MAEKRQNKRHRRRHSVKFGEGAYTHSGLTHDVSATGMFLVTNQLFPLRTRVHVQMFVDTTRFICFEAEVRRHKVIPVELRSVERGGMGLRLLTPTELMREILDGGRLRVTVTYPSAAAFRVAYERELKGGQLVLRAQRPLPKDTKLLLELSLPFVPVSVEVEATVVGPAPGAVEGAVTLRFDSPESAAGLAPYLSSP